MLALCLLVFFDVLPWIIKTKLQLSNIKSWLIYDVLFLLTFYFDFVYFRQNSTLFIHSSLSRSTVCLCVCVWRKSINNTLTLLFIISLLSLLYNHVKPLTRFAQKCLYVWAVSTSEQFLCLPLQLEVQSNSQNKLDISLKNFLKFRKLGTLTLLILLF